MPAGCWPIRPLELWVPLSSDDQEVPLIDLSATADREEILADALAHAATQEAHLRQPLPETKRTGAWKAPLAMMVFTLSAYLLAFPPPWISGTALPTISESARVDGTRAAIFIQAQQIEAFRVRRGRLPGSLEEVEGALPGIRFVRSNSRVFQLVATDVGRPSVIYDSTRPIDEFAGAAAAWGVPQQ